MSNQPTNGWNEWGKHVLKELERQNDIQDKIWNKIGAVSKDVSANKINLENHLNHHSVQHDDVQKRMSFTAGIIAIVVSVVITVVGWFVK